MSSNLSKKSAGADADDQADAADRADADVTAGADAATETAADAAAGSARPVRVAHIGIAVRDLDEALRLYHETLGLPLHGRETVESDRVTVAFLPAGDTELELLQATDPESPVARFIEKRGEGIHHVALEVDDVAESLKNLREKGYRLIDEKPRMGAGGARVAFVHPRGAHGVLIELCEKGGGGRP